MFEITNQAPTSSMSMEKSKTADIVFTVGNAEEEILSQYTAATQKVQERLKEMGIDAKVSTVSTSALTAQDTFAWTEYDHYNYQDMHLPTMEKHILYEGNDIKMMGYSQSAVKDFLFVDDKDDSVKVFEFDLQRDGTDWHSMEGGGFLFNTIVNTEHDYIKGYCVLVTQSGLQIIQMRQTGLENFRNGYYWKIQYVGNLLQTFPIEDVYGEHHFKIIVDKNTITIYDGATLVVENYVVPDDGVEAYGYGPITSHYAHNCSQQSYFTFKNITMQTITGESLSDVVNSHEWTPGTNHYVINLSETSVPELSDHDSMADVTAAMIKNDAMFFGIGNETTMDQYNGLLNSMEGMGENIRLSGTSDEGVEDSSYQVNAEEAVEQIVARIVADIRSKDYAIGYTIATDEEVVYNGTYMDPENDPVGTEEWTYCYDASVFGEIQDEIKTMVQETPITMFTEAGAYEISHRVSDDPTGDNEAMDSYIQWSDTDEYKKLILSQHRPTASITVNTMQSETDRTKCLVNVVYSSEDPDHPTDSRKGIREEKFYYKELGDTQWTEGRFPTQVELGSTYLVKYVVTDIEGTVSRPAVEAVKTSEARTYMEPVDTNPPEVNLTVSTNLAEVGEIFYIEASAMDDYGVNSFSVKVNGEEFRTTYGRYGYQPEQAGEYTVTATAVDIGGNETVKTFTVTVIDNSDVIPPDITLTSQTNGAIAGNIVIMGSITDNKELKSYTVTRRKVDTGTGESSADSSETGENSETGDATDTGENEESVIIASGTEEIVNNTIAEVETSGLENGVYQIEILAEDAAGLTSCVSLMFTVNRKNIDKIPPQAVIDDIVMDEEGDTISVIGSVTDETKIGSYELIFFQTDKPDDTTIIAAGTTALNGEMIGTIPTRYLVNGDYTLQLLAWDSQGNSSGMEVVFEYEETINTQTGTVERVEIKREEDTTIPVITGELKAAITKDGLSLTLTGTVADENLKEYTVVTGKADSENNPVSPIALKTGTETVENATIAQYTYDKFEAGTYMIRVTAVDEAGNKRVMDFFTTVTVQGNIDDGYTGESGESGESNSDSLNLVLSGTVADTGDTLKVYLTYPEEATDIRLTAEGAEVELYGRIADITSDTPGEVEITLTANIKGEEKSVTRTVRFFDPADTTHPKASFLTPEADSELKTKTEITGTVWDETGIAYYTLEYRMEGTDTFREISGGEEMVEEGVLGELDTTLLENGRYLLRLTVVDNGGNRIRVERAINVTGNLKVGNLSLSFTDINANVSGVPLTVIRSYDSRNKNSGDFGTGWRLGLQSVRLTEANDITTGYEMVQQGIKFSTTYQIYQTICHDVTITYGDGTSDRFALKLSPERQGIIPIYEVKVNFVCETNPKLKLQLDGDNQALLYGEELVFDDESMLGSRNYILTREDGTKWYISAEHGLLKMEDTNGNTVTMTKNGFTHSDGNGITFTRDEKGRIIKAEETSKEGTLISSLTYAYDDNDNLIAVTDKAGRTVTFTYDDDHNLIDIIDPSGMAVARNEYDENGRLVAAIDAEGNRLEYKHDIDGRTETVRDKMGNITVYTYDDNGNILKTVDALGNVTTSTYDENNNLLTATDANGNTTSYEYDSYGNITAVTGADGTKVECTYTQQNQVSSISTMDRTVVAMEYDSSGNLSSVEDGEGNTVSYSYTKDGKLTGMADAIGEYQKVTYDTKGNVASTTNGAGETTTYTYDEKGQCTGITISREENGETITITSHYVYNTAGDIIQSIDNMGNVTSYEYDSNGNQTAAVDAKGRRFTYEYDSLGNMVKTTYPDGTFETFAYDANGNCLTATDRSGQSISMKYDKMNRLVQKNYADGTFETYTYDAVGNVTEHTSAGGAKTIYTYDNRNCNTAITDAYGNVTTFAYDSQARLTSVTDAMGNIISYQYDGNGYITKTTYADGNSVTCEYDERNRVTAQKDQNGNETRYEYDGADRLTKVTDALGNSYTYGYDQTGNLVTVTDANGNITRYSYDTLGRVKTVENAMGNTMEYSYDKTGNVTEYKDYSGTKTLYTYDGMDRLIEKKTGNEKTTYTYDELGLLIRVTDHTGTVTYQYDQYQRLTGTMDTRGNQLSYSYDETGRLKTFDNGFGATTYEYDLLDRVTRVIDHNGNATEYEYDALGNRSAVRYPNGTVMTYTYDACQRLKEECVTDANGNLLSRYTYGLGKAGERLTITEETDGITTEISYTYDSLNRLVKETIKRNQNELTNEYTYDKVSNRISKTTTVTGELSELADTDSDEVDITEGTTTYTYNALNQLVTETTPEGTITYTYDGNGNLIQKSGKENAVYTYDVEKHLLSAEVKKEDSVTKESYTYDYAGNRISKTVEEGETTDTTYYVTETSGSLSQVVAETNEAGEITAFYTLGEDLISMERNGETWYYIYDGHGSVRHLTDSNGTVTDSYSYDAYGNLLEKEGTTENDFLYAGEQYNAGTGLYYLRARYMDPSTGTFISMDSYQGSIYDPVSLHKYLYANANPVMYTDPSGYSADATLLGVNVKMAASNILNASLNLAFKTLKGAFFGAAFAAIDSKLGGNDFQQILQDTIKGAKMGALFGFGIPAVAGIAAANIVLLSPIAFTMLTITPVVFACWGYQGVKESLSNGHKLQAAVRGITAIFSVVGSVKLIKDVKIKMSNSGGENGSKTKLVSYYEYKALKQQGYNASEAYALMKQFRSGINPNNEFAFHFTTFKGGKGITDTGGIYGSKSGVWGKGIYTGTTSTPSWLLKHIPWSGWGLGNAPVRIPIKLNSSMTTSKPIIPVKSIVIRTEFLDF